MKLKKRLKGKRSEDCDKKNLFCDEISLRMAEIRYVRSNCRSEGQKRELVEREVCEDREALG